MKKNKDTIVAISTPPGMGGVGVVRLSGSSSLSITQTLFQKNSSETWSVQKMYYGFVQDPRNCEKIDDGYAVYFSSSHSFTGEDVVELQLHGNSIVLEKVIELCQQQGARLAKPGEFTQRAYLNGKMDLLQAEAVAELIHSQSIVEAQRARLRLDGKLSSHLQIMRDEIIDVLAEIEADVDFPEENIDLSTQKKLLDRIENVKQTANSVLSTYQRNQKITSGFRVVLVGKPNVGKSSLFNALLQHDRAIVTPHAGTTRDVLSEEMILSGYRVKLLDTAGLRRDIADEIEKEGVERSGREISKADLILWLVAADQQHTETELERLHDLAKEKSWLVWNKVDLAKPSSSLHPTFEKQFLISAKTGEGVEKLLQDLESHVQHVCADSFGGGISNDRQKEHLVQMMEHFTSTQKMIRDRQPAELLAAEFRLGFHAINRMLGKEENMEDVYDRIFSKFCIGK